MGANTGPLFDEADKGDEGLVRKSGEGVAGSGGGNLKVTWFVGRILCGGDRLRAGHAGRSSGGERRRYASEVGAEKTD